MNDGFDKKSPLWPLWLIAPVFGFLVFLYISIGDNFIYTQWSVRDLIRSANLLNDFQVMGAEMDRGAGMRLPGGFLHYLWFLPLAVSSSPLVSFYFTVALNLAGMVFFFLMIKRYWGPYCALFSSCVFLASNVFYITVVRLWNPAFLPLFIIIAYDLLCRVVIDGRMKYAKWFFLVVSLGVQIHMSALMLALPFIAAVLFFQLPRIKEQGGFRSFLKQTFLCVLFFVLPFAPYLISEMNSGFANTLMLSHQYFFETANQTSWARDWWITFCRMFRHFVPLIPREENSCGLLCLVFANLSVVLMCGGFAAFIASVVLRKADAYLFNVASLRRFGAFCAFLFVFTVPVYTCVDSERFIFNIRTARYLLVLLPAAAFFAGYFAVAICRRLGRSRMVFAAAAVLSVALLVQTAYSDLALRRIQEDELSFSGLGESRRVIQNLTGWGLEEMAGRVMFRMPDMDKGWTWAHLIDFATYELFCAGITDFPGSGAMPGVIVLLHAGSVMDDVLNNPDVADERFARVFLKQDVPGFRILEKKLVGGDLFVLYTCSGGRSFASMTTKYILTEREKEIAAYYGTVPVCGVKELAPDKTNGLARFVMCLDENVYGMIEINSDNGRLSAVLHSNQLRGASYNVGVFHDVLMDWPRLVIVPETGRGETALEFAAGFAGVNGILAPLSASCDIVPGKYALRFETSLICNIDDVCFKPAMIEPEKIERRQVGVDLGTIEIK